MSIPVPCPYRNCISAARRFGARGFFRLAAILLGLLAVTADAATFTLSGGGASPASGSEGGVFHLGGTAGTGMSVSIEITGTAAPGSWALGGNVPAGIGLENGASARGARVTLSGTPTTSGTYIMTVAAYEGVNNTGTSHGITCVVVVAPAAAGEAPVFVTNPSSAVVPPGESVLMRTLALGSPAPAYQWYKDDTAIAGATGHLLRIDSLASGHAGSYKVIATNSAGSVTSSVATLVVGDRTAFPQILEHPQATTALSGSSVHLSVVAFSPQAVTYQWKKDGTDISGATGSVHTIAQAAASDAGSYSVVVSAGGGSATSAAATLTVATAAAAPTISAAPVSSSTLVGVRTRLSATVTGTWPMTFQWAKDGADIPGATGRTLVIPSATLADAGSYTFKVTNSAGSATSEPAVLSVTTGNLQPAISRQPVSLTVATGADAWFQLELGGVGPYRIQWRKDGAWLADGITPLAAVTRAQPGDAGTYVATVGNDFGSVISQAVTLTVSGPITPPVLHVPSTSASVAWGRSISFTVQNTGGPAQAYRWQVSADGGVTWADIADGPLYSGTGTDTLTILNATADMNGRLYRARVSYSGGLTYSSGIRLTTREALIAGPAGLDADASGVMFVTDSLTNTVRRVTAAGVVSVLAGSPGTQGSDDGTGTAARFRQPAGVALDGSGNLYVADAGNSLIRRVSPAGVVTTLAGSAANQGHRDGAASDAWFNAPAALALTSAGDLVVADTGNSVVRRITAGGTVSTLAGTPGVRGSADGTGSAALFNQPAGIAVDATGNIYVADTLNHLIRRVTTQGVVTTVAGIPGVSGAVDGPVVDALFNQPMGLEFDGSGSLLVADAGNSVIRRITPAGQVSTVAGLPTVGGLKDGRGADAWFNQPRDLRLAANGAVMVADHGSSALRRVAADATVTTLALTAEGDDPGGGSGGGGSGGGGGGGGGTDGGSSGGGAPSGWFLAALATAALLRRRLHPAS